MSTSSFSADLNAVAGAAGSFSQNVVGVAFNAAEFNGFDVGKTIKYNLNRLEGLRMINSGKALACVLAAIGAAAASVADALVRQRSTS